MSTISARFARRIAVTVHSARSFPSATTAALHARAYHSEISPEPAPFSQTESTILSAALAHVPEHGFTETALTRGTRDAGYLDVSTNLFPRGVFDLIMYHLATRRLALKDEVQFPAPGAATQMGVGAKVRSIALHRLRANEPVIRHWSQALSVMAQPSYVSPSLHELSLLVDEMWFLAGDQAVDMSWYTKRASLAAIYSASEVFMTTDRSAGFVETEQFLDRRLEELRTVGGSFGAVSEWVGVSGKSFVNVLRSKGVRI